MDVSEILVVSYALKTALRRSEKEACFAPDSVQEPDGDRRYYAGARVRQERYSRIRFLGVIILCTYSAYPPEAKKKITGKPMIAM